jgi:RES domain-containing protein
LTLSVYRIGFSGALSLADQGYGSTLQPGRWHKGCSASMQMVYCGSSRALCQLERRVHSNGATPKDMAAFRLDISSAALLLDSHALGLPTDWRSDQSISQAFGMQWLASKASLGLWVPSYVVPLENNLLLNPQHAAYPRVKLLVEQNPFVFDPRLFVTDR